MKRIDVAIAVLVRGGHILICQRKTGDTFGGYWEFPGGKCETGETLEGCLVREMREEVDMLVQPLEKLASVEHDYPQAKLTLHAYLCQSPGGEPKLIECQDARWVAPAELKNYRFPPANEIILRQIIGRFTDAP